MYVELNRCMKRKAHVNYSPLLSILREKYWQWDCLTKQEMLKTSEVRNFKQIWLGVL